MNWTTPELNISLNYIGPDSALVAYTSNRSQASNVHAALLNAKHAETDVSI